MSPGKRISYDGVEFPTLKALADYHGVGASGICKIIPTGVWRGKPIFYIDDYGPCRPHKVNITNKHYKWLYDNRPVGGTVDDFMVSIISDAMK